MSKEFDTAKGAFYLVALVVVTQMFVVVVVMGFCTAGILYGALSVGACKEIQSEVMEIFNMAFTAAIAFAGGRMSVPNIPPPKLPPEHKDEPP